MSEQFIIEENGKRYRMLQVGETIQKGDEVNLDNGQWRPFNHPDMEPNVVQHPDAGCMPQGYYRRPIA